MGGADENNFWADELFVSTSDSVEVEGELTGRLANGLIIQATTQRSCSILTATISRLYFTAKLIAVRLWCGLRIELSFNTMRLTLRK